MTPVLWRKVPESGARSVVQMHLMLLYLSSKDFEFELEFGSKLGGFTVRQNSIKLSLTFFSVCGQSVSSLKMLKTDSDT